MSISPKSFPSLDLTFLPLSCPHKTVGPCRLSSAITKQCNPYDIKTTTNKSYATQFRLIEMVDVLSWDKSIDKDVKTNDDKKVGKVRAVTMDYIQIQKGTVEQKVLFCAQTLHPGI